MFMCFVKYSSVLNLIYSGQRLFSYITVDRQTNRLTESQTNKQADNEPPYDFWEKLERLSHILIKTLAIVST